MITMAAGRRIDSSHATPPRFPLANRTLVRRRIRSALQRMGATALVASAACGADLLALDVARTLGLRRRIILPYAESWFLEDSVTDRLGRWAALYRSLCDQARKSMDLVVLDLPRGEDSAFIAASDAILAEALRLARQEMPAHPAVALAALIVWEGTPRGADDITARLMEQVHALGAPVTQVLTLRTTRKTTANVI